MIEPSLTDTSFTCKELDNILKKNRAEKGNSHTNTRIGSKELSIYGGTYNIEYNDKFWDVYYNHVFKNNNNEYLTEKQLLDDGPLLVDIDLRYNNTVKERLHTKTHIIELMELYLSKLNELYNIDNNTEIDIYVLEKPNVNILEDKTKDGIHMIFTIKMHKAEQVILRKKILNEIKDIKIWSELPLSNNFEDVIDEGITKGCVNWQMFGSKKPGHEAYELRYCYNSTYNSDDELWNLNEKKVCEINIRKTLPLLSARYNNHISFDLIDNIYVLDAVEQEKANFNTKSKQRKTDCLLEIDNIDFQDLSKIKNIEELDDIINKYILDDDLENYELKETYLFTMILPESYYAEGSYNKWIRVGWALRNNDDKSSNNFIKSDKKCFLIWLKFSSQYNRFNFATDVLELYNMWKLFDNNNPDGLTKRSILFWAKSDNYSEYLKIREATISYYVDKTLDSIMERDKVGEFDLASVLYQLCKDQYVCVNIKNNIWYEYKNNRWQEIDSGNTLRILISKKMHDIYIKKASALISTITQLENNDQKSDTLKVKATKIGDICVFLKTTSWKANIMKEAKDLFYDPKFIEKLNANPYLLGFNNGVIDFKNKIFRKGRPDDYISKTTNIDYIPYDKLSSNYTEIMNEINKFIDELFPNTELRMYMWQHLASTLIGTNENQTFNIYTGSGCNGKSKLIELMGKCLGEYYASVPITLITQVRNSIGSTSSEVVQLIGARYVTMNEGSKGDKINEGILKELTGGDPIQARALYKESISFIPQFKLAVCTNTLFDITSNDDGTWRRIRVCDFASKFVDKPYEDEFKFPRANFPYQYEIDRKINEKFILWAPVLMSMLTNTAFETLGFVKDVKVVTSISDKYREGQDYLTEFVKDKVIRKRDSKIKKTEILEEFKNWYIMHYGKNNIPKGREITDFMDKTFGKCNRGKWLNVEMRYNDEDDEDNDYDSE